MAQKDDLNKLYNALITKGYSTEDLGDENIFRSKMKDKNNRKQLYDYVSGRGDFRIGDYDSYENRISNAYSITKLPSPEMEGSTSKAGPKAQEVVDEYDSFKRMNAQNEEGNREQSVPSPYVGKDDSGRITVFGVPYDEYQNMPKEEQSKVYSKAIKDRKDQELKGFTAHASDLKASVNSELKEVMDLHNAEEKSYAKEHPVLSFLQGFGQAQTGGRNQRTIEANPRYRNLMAAANLLKDSENRLAEASADKSSSISNFGRGVRDKALDVDTWTAGFSKLADNTALLSALDKANKQEQLTSDEEKLLDALVTNLTVNAYTQSDISRGYQIGETTAYSLPFMLEFIANPIASSGNVIAKKLLTYGLKKFGKAATSKAAKVAGRLTGDIVAATGMTATTSLPRVAADTAGRLADNYTYDVDDNGELVVNKTGNTSFVGAAAKSAASRLIENQSEMIFNAFRGTGGMLWGTINKVMPEGVSSFFRKAANLKPVEWFRELANNETMREVAKRAQFHGIGEEYLEEVYNNFANIPLGEMTFEEAINLDNNITTFLSLAPTQIGFSLLGLGSMAVNRYSNRKKMRALFEKMTPEQQAKLTELTQMSKERGNEDIKKFIEITIADKNLTTEQKKDEIEYAFELAKQNAIEDLQQEQTPEGRAADDAYVQGTELPVEQRYSAEQERVAAEEALREIDENALNTIDRMLADDASANEIEEIISGMDEDSAKLARDYYNKSMRINGIVDSARDDAEEAVASFEASLQEAIIPDAEGNGTITTATLMSGAGEVKEEVYVIANDGVQATILQKDGTKKMVNSGLLDNMQTSLANDVVQLYQDRIGEQMRDQTDMSLNHHPKTRVPQPGMQIWNGDMPLIITEVNADGSVRAFPAVLNNKTGLMESKNGSTPVDMSVKESLDLQDDYYNKMDDASIGVNLSEKEGENAIGSRDEESKVSEDGTDYTLSDKTSDNGEPFYQDNSGNIDLAVIPQEVFDAIGKKAAPFRIIPSMLKHVFDRHGREMSLEEPQDAILFVLDVMDNFDHVRKGDKGALIFSIENGRSRTGKRAVTVLIDSKNGDYYGIKTSGYERIDGLQKRALLWEKGANETSTTGVAPANVTTAKAQQGNRQSGSASNQSNALSENKDTQKSSENQEVNVNNSIQFDEKGNPLYHKAPVETTVAYLSDGSLTDEEIDLIVAANQAEANKQLEKAIKDTPKIVTNKEKYVAAKKAWQAKVDDARQQSEYWKEVASFIKQQREQPGDKITEEILSMGEPLNELELAAQKLANGSLPLLYEDYKRELGFSNEEAGKMFGLFKSRENGGLTIEEAGEVLMQNDLEEGSNFFDQEDANAGRNAILEVLSSARTRGDLIEYIRKKREAASERERRSEEEYDENQRDAWYEEHYGMSYADYVTFEEVINDIIQEKALSKEAIQEFYDNFADEFNNWNNGRITEETAVNERGSVDSRSESSEGLLPTEQLSDNRGIETDISAEADERADNKGVPASEKSIITEIETAREQVDTNPSDAQKEAGNYKKGHIKLDGYDITIENPKGSERSGTDADGNKWSITMNNDYGYIRGTESIDGDHIDIFLSDNPAEGNVYVIDQLNTTTGEFDEHKVMYGFSSMDEATQAYLSNYSPGWQGLGAISEVSKDEFKKWIDSSHRKTKPFADYKSVEVSKRKRRGFSNLGKGKQIISTEDKFKEEKEKFSNQDLRRNDYARVLQKSKTVEEAIVAFKKMVKEQREIADDWRSRIYKKNNTIVEGEKGLDPYETTISNANERRRMTNIRAAEKRALEIEGYIDILKHRTGYKEETAGDNQGKITSEPVSPLENGGKTEVKLPQSKSNAKNKKRAADIKQARYELMDAKRELSVAQATNSGYTPEEVEEKKKRVEKAENELKEFTNKVSNDSIRFREIKDGDITSFAQKYNLDESDVGKYAKSMNVGNLGGASYAFKNIKRSIRLLNSNLSLGEFVKVFAPVKADLYEKFGNVDALRDEYVQQEIEQRNVMEAARKRAEEEAETERKRLEEFELMTDTEMDASYFKALEENDDPRMRDIVNEAARRKGYVSADEFRMAHRAPSYDEEGYDKSMVDVANDKDNIRQSLNEQLKMNRDTYKDESASAINEALSAIDEGKHPTVTIYRAVPKSLKEGRVRNGDWVSLSESYVKTHGEHALNGDYRIIKEEVPAENLYWDGNDINEWGYDDRSDYRYKDTKNNRKLSDLITRDDNGNIIPPSKRFNARKADTRYRLIGEQETANFDKVSKQREIIQTVEDLSDKLNTPIHIVRSLNEIPDGSAKRAIEEGRKVKAWFDTGTREIFFYIPNATDVNDAKVSILHEVVGHKGLRNLFGTENETKFDSMMMDLFEKLSLNVRSEIADMAVSRYANNVSVAMDEYLAEQAEKDETPGWWDRVVSAIRDFFRKMGVDVELSENDVKYLLWRSRKKLETGDLFEQAKDVVMRNKLGIGLNETQETSKSAPTESTRFRIVGGIFDSAGKDVEVVERETGNAREMYDRTLQTAGYKMRESWQDSMLGLKEAQDAIAKATHSRILDYENAYMAENALSSRSLAEINAYRELVYKPILEEIAQMKKQGAKYEDISDYLITKHGIERNREMAVRKAFAEDEDTVKENIERWTEDKKNIWNNGSMSWKEKQEELDRIATSYGADMSVDYSGLSAMFPNDDMAETTAEAYKAVEGFEEKFETAPLLDKVKAATTATLDKQRDSGLMNKDTYKSIQDMYQFYVPLRGWEEKTADEVYDYITSETPVFNAPLKTAKGRTSKSDDPLPTIANIAESGILQGNRNLMKQKFLTMVENHRSNLVSVSELWVKYDAVNDKWIAIFPEIPNNASAEEVENIVSQFNARMEELSKNNPDEYKKASDARDIPYKILPNNLKEHQVIVKRNGKEYVLTINGNPRAAQALNGLTNPNATNSPIIKLFESTNRFLAANFTQRNPAFVISNMFRDGFYSNSVIWVKESPLYAKKYNKNWAKSFKEMGGLVKRYKTNSLDMNNNTDRMFLEFINNGGETGYTFINSVEEYKGIIAKELKKQNRSKLAPGTAFDILGEAMDTFGRWAEDTSRFAAYRTSREMGRSIARSISDAKEISVNFNKKGSGAKTAGQWEKGNRLNFFQAWASQTARGLYIFWNAGVQGLTNFARLAKRNPGKFAGLASSYFVLGTMMPIINAAIASTMGGDGDEDDYYNLPEYVRRNNICIYVGGEWITMPLPIELRAIYGLGELASGLLSGKENMTGGKLTKKIAEQVSQIMPIDMMEGGGGFSAFVPSYVKPAYEVWTNKDWTGIPIYRKNDFNKNMPEWTKAYSSTSPELVKLSEIINEWTGGTKYKTGMIDFNPAIVEHLFESYLGGVGTTINQLKKTLMMPFNEDLQELRNAPVISRFMRSADSRSVQKRIDEEYFNNRNRFELIQQEVNGYKKELNNPQTNDFDYAKYQTLYNKMINSDKYRKYIEFKEMDKVLKRMRDAFKQSGNEELEAQMFLLKEAMNEVAK